MQLVCSAGQGIAGHASVYDLIRTRQPAQLEDLSELTVWVLGASVRKSLGLGALADPEG